MAETYPANIDPYAPIRAEPIEGEFEISNIPIPWHVENVGDFYVIAISEDGEIIEDLASDYLDFDNERGVLSIKPIFGDAEFENWESGYRVYIFRREDAVNLFSIKSDGNANIASILAQFEKDNRVLAQLQALTDCSLRSPDKINTLPDAVLRKGKVLAFDGEGNPDLSLSKEDVQGAYDARDEAKNLKEETESLKKETASLKLDAQTYKDYAAQSATKAFEAQNKAETAKAETEAIKGEVESTVGEFNSTVNSKVQEVETAGTDAVQNVNAAKTDAVGEIAGIKGEVETAGEEAVGEINAARAGAKTEIANDLANAKSQIDGWSDQTERFAQNEASISALSIDKANAGYLQFNNAKLTTAANNATTLPLTLCATYDCAEYPSDGLFSILSTHKIIGYTAAGQAGSMSGFEFGFCYNQNFALTMFGIVLSTPDAVSSTARHGCDIGLLTSTEALRARFTGRHTFVASISADITNGVPQATLYLDGVQLTGLRNTIYNGGLQSAELDTGQGKILTGGTRYSATNISSMPLKLSRLKIFNCVLPATNADDVNGIGYTIEDYANGIDEPPTMQDASATYRALLSLQDYTVQNGSTQQIFDVSGNANDATVTLADGGSVKGLNDNAVGRLVDFIKGQSA